MSIVKITAVGDKELLKQIHALGTRGFQAAKKVIYQKAEVISGRAKESVPVDTGALRSTIHVEIEEGDTASASVVAGGPAAPYAAIVHEDMLARHTVGGPKYIERPVLEVMPSIAPAIRRAITQASKGK